MKQQENSEGDKQKHQKENQSNQEKQNPKKTENQEENKNQSEREKSQSIDFSLSSDLSKNQKNQKNQNSENQQIKSPSLSLNSDKSKKSKEQIETKEKLEKKKQSEKKQKSKSRSISKSKQKNQNSQCQMKKESYKEEFSLETDSFKQIRDPKIEKKQTQQKSIKKIEKDKKKLEQKKISNSFSSNNKNSSEKNKKVKSKQKIKQKETKKNNQSKKSKQNSDDDNEKKIKIKKSSEAESEDDSFVKLSFNNKKQKKNIISSEQNSESDENIRQITKEKKKKVKESFSSEENIKQQKNKNFQTKQNKNVNLKSESDSSKISDQNYSSNLKIVDLKKYQQKIQKENDQTEDQNKNFQNQKYSQNIQLQQLAYICQESSKSEEPEIYQGINFMPSDEEVDKNSQKKLSESSQEKQNNQSNTSQDNSEKKSIDQNKNKNQSKEKKFEKIFITTEEDSEEKSIVQKKKQEKIYQSDSDSKEVEQNQKKETEIIQSIISENDKAKDIKISPNKNKILKSSSEEDSVENINLLKKKENDNIKIDKQIKDQSKQKKVQQLKEQIEKATLKFKQENFNQIQQEMEKRCGKFKIIVFLKKLKDKYQEKDFKIQFYDSHYSEIRLIKSKYKEVTNNIVNITTSFHDKNIIKEAKYIKFINNKLSSRQFIQWSNKFPIFFVQNLDFDQFYSNGFVFLYCSQEVLINYGLNSLLFQKYFEAMPGLIYFLNSSHNQSEYYNKEFYENLSNQVLLKMKQEQEMFYFFAFSIYGLILKIELSYEMNKELNEFYQNRNFFNSAFKIFMTIKNQKLEEGFGNFLIHFIKFCNQDNILDNFINIFINLDENQFIKLFEILKNNLQQNIRIKIEEKLENISKKKNLNKQGWFFKIKKIFVDQKFIDLIESKNKEIKKQTINSKEYYIILKDIKNLFQTKQFKISDIEELFNKLQNFEESLKKIIFNSDMIKFGLQRQFQEQNYELLESIFLIHSNLVQNLLSTEQICCLIYNEKNTNFNNQSNIDMILKTLQKKQVEDFVLKNEKNINFNDEINLRNFILISFHLNDKKINQNIIKNLINSSMSFIDKIQFIDNYQYLQEPFSIKLKKQIEKDFAKEKFNYEDIFGKMMIGIKNLQSKNFQKILLEQIVPLFIIKIDLNSIEDQIFKKQFINKIYFDLIDNLEIIKDTKWIQEIKQDFFSFFNKIIEKKYSYKKFEKLFKIISQQKMNEKFEKINKILLNQQSNIIEQIQKKEKVFTQIKNEIEMFQWFINNFFIQINREQAEEFLKKFNDWIKEVKNNNLTDYQIPKTLHILKKYSQILNNYRNSIIFYNFYNENPCKDLDNLENSFQMAIGKFLDLFESFKTYKNLNYLEQKKFFKDTKIEVELNCFQQTENLEEKFFLKLKEDLILIFENNCELEKNMKFLTKLDNYIKYNDKLGIKINEFNQIFENKKVTIGEILENYEKIQKYLKEFSNEEIQQIFKLSNLLSKSFKIIEYIDKLEINQIDIIQEIQQELDSKEDFIDQLFQIKNFISKIKFQQMNFSEFFKKIFKDQKQINQLIFALEDCYKNIEKIKNVFENIQNFDTQKKEQIKRILIKSSLNFIKINLDKELKQQNSENYFDIDLNDFKESYNYQKIKELINRSKILKDLIKNNQKGNQNLSQEDQKNLYNHFQNFINFGENIFQILNNLNEYAVRGKEPQHINKKIEIQDNNIDELLKFQTRTENFILDFEKYQNKQFEDYPVLTFLEGEEMKQMFKAIKSKTIPQTIKNKLFFMNKNPNQDFSNFNFKQNIEEKEYLKELGECLQSLPNLEQIEKKINIQTDQFLSQSEKKQNIYVLSNCNQLVFGVLTVFLRSQQSMPKCYQILYCNQNTKWSTIFIFLMRCLLIQNYFCIITPENLSEELQKKMFEFLYDLLKKSQFKDNSLKVVLITQQNSCYLTNMCFQKLNQITEKFKDQFLLTRNELGQIHCINVQCFLSQNSGYGKTDLIKQNSNNANKILISGKIDFQFYIESLSTLDFNIQNTLWIEIGQSNEIESINMFLLFLCIIRQFNIFQNKFQLPNQVQILIEISNSFLNSLENQLYILQFFKQQKIERCLIEKFTFQNNSKKVCNYMNSLQNNQIDQNISPDSACYKTDLGVQQYQQLLIQFYSAKISNEQSFSFTDLNNFLSISICLINNFEKSSQFSNFLIKQNEIAQIKNKIPSKLQNQYRNLVGKIRSSIITEIFSTALELTTKSIENTRWDQNLALKQMDFKEKIKAIQQRENNRKSWNTQNHFYLMIYQDGSCTPIYDKIQNVPDSIKILLSIYEQSKKTSKQLTELGSDLENFEKLTQNDFLLKLKIINPKFLTNQKVQELEKGNYVLTIDNFLKMNYIYLKVLSNIPLIIMGESGCGKTRLIEFFVKDILNQDFLLFSIHAGINKQKIFQKMQEILIKCQNIGINKYWVVFDEFNTSPEVSLLGEILCEKIFNGKSLPNNLILVGICNPLKITTLYQYNIGLQKPDQHFSFNHQPFLHQVNPLPEKVIQNVWDFGQLDQIDMKKYIKAKINQISFLTEIQKEKYIEILSEIHIYFNTKNSGFNVSLRDLTRFCDLLYFFIQMQEKRMKVKLEEPSETYSNNLNLYPDHNKQIQNNNLIDFRDRAAILSFITCYQFRLVSKLEKEEILKMVQKINTPQIILQELKQFIITEQMEIILRMKLRQNMALNRILRENIFGLISCIFTKIPIFLCGKPGTSKTTAVNLVFDNFLGEYSLDPFFQQYPQLRKFYYQGSNTATSETIEKTYLQAEKVCQENKDKNQKIIPVFFFDEMGQAEFSKHNPLKILHSKLELENRENKPAFIGISNYLIDASKLNRVLLMGITDLDEEDLKETALGIFDSQKISHNEYYKKILDVLSESYYINYTEFQKYDFKNIYGLRDFYNMVLYYSYKLSVTQLNDNQKAIEIGYKSIERNFGGIHDASKRITETFTQKLESSKLNLLKYEPQNNLDLIKANLRDKFSRYLMIICENEIIIEILTQLIKTKFLVMFGSIFKKDQKNEDYIEQNINELVSQMELGTTVILSNMDFLYNSFFDVFNQSYNISSGKKYTQVNAGFFYKNRCLVNDDFKVIVIVKKNELKNHDPAFLNRFEKHYFDINNQFTERDHKIKEELIQWFKNFQIFHDQEVSVKLNYLFPTYSEEILSLELYNQRKQIDQDISKNIKKKMLQASQGDVLIISQGSKFEKEEQNFIKKTWLELHEKNLLSLIENQNQKSLNIIFVNINYFSNLQQNQNYSNNEKYLFLSNNNLSSEKIIYDLLNQFYTNANKEILFIEMNISQKENFIIPLTFLIEKVYQNFAQVQKKKIFLLVELSRNPIYNQSNSIYFKKIWNIQSFSEKDEIICKILDKDMSQFIMGNLKEKYFDFKEFIEETKHQIYATFNYNIENSIKQKHIYIQKQELTKEHIIIFIQRKIEEVLSSNVMLRQLFFQKKDWRDLMLTNLSNISQNTENIHDSFKSAIFETLKILFQNILMYFENEGGLENLFYLKDNKNIQIWENIVNHIFKSSQNVIRMKLSFNQNSNICEYQFTYSFPFTKIIYNSLQQCYDNMKQKLTSEKDSANVFYSCIKEEFIIKAFIVGLMEEKEIPHIIFFKSLLEYQLNKKGFIQWIDVVLNIYQLEKDTRFNKKKYYFKMILQIFELEEEILEILNTFQILKNLKEEDLQNQLLEKYQKMQQKKITLKTLKSFQEADFVLILNQKILSLLQETNLKNKIQENLEFFRMLYQQSLKISIDSFIQANIEFYVSLFTFFEEENFLELKQVKTILELNNSKNIGNNFLLSSKLKENIDQMINKALSKETNEKFMLNFEKFLVNYIQIKLKFDLHFIEDIAEIMNNNLIINNSTNLINIIIEQSNILESIKFYLDPISTEKQDQSKNIQRILDKVLKSTNLNHSLFSIIADKCINKVLDQKDLTMEKSYNLLEEQENYFLNSIKTFYPEQSKLQNFIYLLEIRIIIELISNILGKLIIEQQTEKIKNNYSTLGRYFEQFKNKPQDMTRQIGKFIFSRIQKISNLDKNSLILELQKQNELIWIYGEKEINLQFAFECFPVNTNNLQKNQEIQVVTAQMFQTPETSLITLLDKLNSQNFYDYYLVLQLQVFTQKKKADFDFNKIISITNQIKNKTMKEQLLYLSNLKEMLKDNNYLYKISQKEKNNNIKLIFSTLIGIVQNSKFTKNCLFNQFFVENEQFPGENVNNKYFIGYTENPLKSYLEDLFKVKDQLRARNNGNFIGEFSFAQSSNATINQCQDAQNCLYLYVLPDCGQPYYIIQCPQCKNQIGGIDHVHVARIGHRKLEESEYISAITQRIKILISKTKKGFSEIDYREIAKYNTFRDLKLFTFRLLRLLKLAGFYHLIQNENLTKEQQNKLLNFEEILKIKKFKDHLEYLYVYMKYEIKNLIDLLNPQFYMKFICFILNEINIILNECQQNFNFTDINETNLFEQFIQQKILEYLTKEIENGNNYQMLLNQQSKQKDEIICSEFYRKLFRQIDRFTIDKMDQNLLFLKNKNQNIEILKNYDEKFMQSEKLQCIKGIMDLTNYINKNYSFKYSRDFTFQSIEMVYKEDKILQQLFINFQNLWNQYLQEDFQWECVKLPRKQFQKSDPFTDIILDTKEETGGRYIVLALEMLCNLQNEILEKFRTILTSNQKGNFINFNQNAILLHNIEENQIICFDKKKNLFEFLKKYCINNIEENRGNEFVFQLDQIEQEIIEQLKNKVLINSDVKKTIQKFKFLGESLDQDDFRPITKIRQLTGAVTISVQLKKNIQNWVESEENEIDKISDIKKLYSYLLKIIDYIQSIAEIEQKTLLEFVKKQSNIKEEKLISLLEKFNEIKMNELISFYEEIEILYFDRIHKNHLPNLIKQKLDDELLQELKKMFTLEGCSITQLEYIIAIKRLILRIGNQIAKQNQKNILHYLLSREDLWSYQQDYEKIENLFETNIMKEIQLRHTLNIIEKLS